jgi:hypothetical protein
MPTSKRHPQATSNTTTPPSIHYSSKTTPNNQSGPARNEGTHPKFKHKNQYWDYNPLGKEKADAVTLNLIRARPAVTQYQNRGLHEDLRCDDGSSGLLGHWSMVCALW